MDLSDGAREDIRVWALAQSPKQYRRICPDCSHTRKGASQKVECLSVRVESDHATYKCWHCAAEGAVHLIVNAENKTFMKKAPAPIPLKAKGAVRSIAPMLDTACLLWLKERKLSEKTAIHYGCTAAMAWYHDAQAELMSIAFPFYEGGKSYAAKVRSVEPNTKLNTCSATLGSLFGIQLVDMEASQDFIITEGEPDALALYEAGVLNAVSVPNGAQSFARSEGNDDKVTYGFMFTAKPLIDKAKRVIIATDDDEQGNKMADEMARRIGKHRCWRMKYPEGCKDANDVLIKHGAPALAECVANAEPWPVSGLYDAAHYWDEMDRLYENGFGERFTPDLGPVDDIYSAQPGLLTIVTGIPGNGKSTFVDQIMVNLAKKYDQVFGICSFENPPAIHQAKLAEMLLEKHFFEDKNGGFRMSPTEKDSVKPFLAKHFKFMDNDDGKKSTLESIIERIKTAVFRWGINGVVIDPYNYIARPKGDVSETQWIDDMLTQLRLTAQHYGVHIWFVAHPTKLVMDSDGNYPPPRGYSISGSNAWYAKADFGLTVHKDPELPGSVRIINWKTRFDWLGEEGEKTILYSTQTNVYITEKVTSPFNSYAEARA